MEGFCCYDIQITGRSKKNGDFSKELRMSRDGKFLDQR